MIFDHYFSVFLGGRRLLATISRFTFSLFLFGGILWVGGFRWLGGREEFPHVKVWSRGNFYGPGQRFARGSPRGEPPERKRFQKFSSQKSSKNVIFTKISINRASFQTILQKFKENFRNFCRLFKILYKFA